MPMILPMSNGEPMPKKSSRVTLEEVLDKPEYVGKSLEYHYDFGDGWEHTIEKIDTEPGDGIIRCVSGSGHGVAEDCGGTEGWKKLKSIFRRFLQANDPEKTIRSLPSDEREIFEWYKQGCSNG